MTHGFITRLASCTGTAVRGTNIRCKTDADICEMEWERTSGPQLPTFGQHVRMIVAGLRYGLGCAAPYPDS